MCPQSEMFEGTSYFGFKVLFISLGATFTRILKYIPLRQPLFHPF